MKRLCDPNEARTNVGRGARCRQDSCQQANGQRSCGVGDGSKLRMSSVAARPAANSELIQCIQVEHCREL